MFSDLLVESKNIGAGLRQSLEVGQGKLMLKRQRRQGQILEVYFSTKKGMKAAGYSQI